MSNNPLTVLLFLVPRDKAEEAAEFLRQLTSLEPAIISQPRMRLDRIELYLQNTDEAKPIQKAFAQEFSFAYKSQTKILHEADWRDKWKEDYRPFKLTKNIQIIPSWITPEPSNKLIQIIMDPGCAFGTGLHETTRFMARYVVKRRKKCASFLDIGFGSGILCFVAAKSGYSKIEGIDFDEHALPTACENAKQNKVAHLIHFQQGALENYPVKSTFDFIGANLDSATLIANAEKLISLMHAKSYLCISGIGIENRREVHRMFKKLKLRCVKKYSGKDWCGFLYKKKKPFPKI